MIRPEDVRQRALDAAGQAILADLSDRRGIKQALQEIDPDVLEELRSTVAAKAIDAYERAMWQPVQRDNPPLGNVLVGIPNAEPGFRGRAYHLGAAHWAQDLSGEEQPPFKGWYRPVLDDKGKTLMFSEIHGKPAWWRPEPPQPGEVLK